MSVASQNLKIKQQIFADLERACRRDAILSTNTSTINIELVGAKTQVRVWGFSMCRPAAAVLPKPTGRACTAPAAATAAAAQRPNRECFIVLAGCVVRLRSWQWQGMHLEPAVAS